MMSTSSDSMDFLKSREPLCAMTPRLSFSSSLVMPIPLSDTMMRRFSLS